ncbi:hypothetical protein VNO80_01831 [Phaseolus coccineus]|uniref:Uncharacterized protein n=1 Tax=Phaseolus coccineus TaxID=3886 RepID=A0AAN9WZX7_PHACN
MSADQATTPIYLNHKKVQLHPSTTEGSTFHKSSRLYGPSLHLFSLEIVGFPFFDPFHSIFLSHSLLLYHLKTSQRVEFPESFMGFPELGCQKIQGMFVEGL